MRAHGHMCGLDRCCFWGLWRHRPSPGHPKPDRSHSLLPLRSIPITPSQVGVCYVIRSIVYVSSARQWSFIYYIVGNVNLNTAYTVFFVFMPSWVIIFAFSSRFLKLESPPLEDRSAKLHPKLMQG